MEKKFIETKILSDYEVLTDTGWVDVESIHKTIEYDVWVVKTLTKELRCADFHILFNDKLEEVFVKDLKIGENVFTDSGIEEIISIIKTNEKVNMYDLELSENSNSRYYTNGFLSHNTVYIRQLLKELTKEDANILYFSPMMVSSITDPSFINFITNWANGNDNKKGILLIEDAEPLLETRDNGRNIGISNLLNLTDGLLNDILKIQIIATFNTTVGKLDKALLRPERLIARKEFKKLCKEDVYTLIEKIGVKKEKIDKFFTDNPKETEMTLAEIYNLKKENEIIEHDVKKSDKKMGF